MIFFGIQEMVADEFDIYHPGEASLPIKKITGIFQISRQKLTKILAFFDQKSKEELTKNKSFSAQVEKDTVLVKFHRLADLADEHTQRMLKENSGVDRESIGNRSDAEARSKIKDLESKDLKAQPALSNTSKKEIENLIDSVAGALSLDGFPKAKDWVAEQRAGSRNPGAILHCLNRLKHRKPGEKVGNPWGYCNRIMEAENGNYNERDCIREHYTYQFVYQAERMEKEGASKAEIERALKNFIGSKIKPKGRM